MIPGLIQRKSLIGTPGKSGTHNGKRMLRIAENWPQTGATVVS